MSCENVPSLKPPVIFLRNAPHCHDSRAPSNVSRTETVTKPSNAEEEDEASQLVFSDVILN